MLGLFDLAFFLCAAARIHGLTALTIILEGDQRGGARKMVYHLLNMEENEHVEVHEIFGFLSENVLDALQEVDAISRGTKCKQFMLSVSLSSPKGEIAPVEYFETTITRIEESLNLEGQSRVGGVP
ncbi:MAG: hypothetical protein KAJ40_01250 [Alphaproteobacteria bacterium]|nr:hypothetical protein [Alphaproteobacteria bacterium]